MTGGLNNSKSFITRYIPMYYKLLGSNLAYWQLSKLYLVFLITTTSYLPIIGQTETVPILSDLEQQLEQDLEQEESETAEFDFNTILESLHYYNKDPLLLNTASTTELASLGLLTPIQINSLQSYIYKIGPLLSIYELQAVPAFDKKTIRAILPYVRIKKGLDDRTLNWASLLKESKSTLYLRWNRIIETKKGYQGSQEKPKSYTGDPNHLYIRYIKNYQNKFSVGFTVEKDAGEQFWKSKKGIDFYSAHLFLKDWNAKISRIVIGDFNARFGQGLVLSSGYAPKKGASIVSVKRNGATLNRYTAVNEAAFFRGAGSTINLSSTFQFTAFYSRKKRDGRLVFSQDSLAGNTTNSRSISSLPISGLHRTVSEIEAKNQVVLQNIGLQIKGITRKGYVSMNGLYTQMNTAIAPSTKSYQQFQFAGSQQWNVSLDYGYSWRSIHFFGETAMDQNGQFATVNGVMSSLHPTIDLVFYSRLLPKKYQSLFGQAFAETNGANNENGVYSHLSIKPNRYWSVDLYMDIWKHPWLRFQIDAPSTGAEFLSRITYTQRKKLVAYFQFKRERKQQSYAQYPTEQKALFDKYKTTCRIHLNYKLNQAIEIRSRIEVADFHIGASNSSLIFFDQAWHTPAETTRKGVLIYQDLLYKPMESPLSFTTRFAIFNIDSYDARIYAYENDVLYQFSIPAYYNKGTRFYLNVKYQLPHLTFEARYTQTYWTNQQTIGNGSEAIDGPKRTGVKFQLRYKF